MSAPHERTARAMLRELSPLIGAVPVAGPPAVLLAAPWLVLTIVLAGPFALLFTFVLVVLAVALVISAVAAIAASPYLLARHLRAARARRETARALVEPVRANPSAKADRALLPTISAPGY